MIAKSFSAKMADGSSLFAKKIPQICLLSRCSIFFISASVIRRTSFNTNINFCNESNTMGKWGVRKGAKQGILLKCD